jgi:hypothetical protein
MRVLTFWTIGNHYTEKVFYGMYLPSDTTFAKTGGGHEGWLEPGKAIDMEVDFPECKIIFWKDRPVWPFGATKLAEPALVTTDRPVTFTKQKTVVQPEKPEFSDPAHVGPVVFLTSMDFNNGARGIVLAGLGKIPEVGGAISAILGLIWSEQKVDLIAESEQRMKRWVQGRFEEFDRQFLQAKLSGLRKLLDEYRNASDLPERARWFDASLGACEQALPFFTERDFTPGTSALAAALGTIHLTLLRERVVHSSDIFDDKHVNMERFKTSLKDALKTYQDYISKVAVPGELKSRQERIVATHFGENESVGPVFLQDWATREVHRFRHSSQANSTRKQDQSVCVNYYREQAEGSLARQLQENVVHTALLWTLLDPDQQNVHPIPLDGVTWTAALAGLGYMYGNTHLHEYNDSAMKKIGRITEVTVQEDGSILGLDFNGSGQHSGQSISKNGRKHAVKVPADAFLTRIETWFGYDLFGIKFHFSDGSTQGPFGTPSRGEVHQTAEFPLHHITAIGIGKRMQELRCGFTPFPDYYERLAKV